MRFFVHVPVSSGESPPVGRNSRDLSSPDWTIRSVHLFDLKRVFYFRAPKAAVLHMPTYIKVKSTCHHQPHLGSKSKVTLTK